MKIPSRLNPLVKPFSRLKLTSKLKPGKKNKKKARQLKVIILTIVGVLTVVLSVLLYIFFKDLPSPKRLESGDYPVSTQIFDRNGSLLYEIFADTHRNPVPLDSLPPHVPQASIAIEDQDFYQHFGFSIQGIIRAAKNTFFQNKLQGGSTITQQLVKTALLTPERTLERKIREAVLTLGTEILYSKDQILEMYLNHIPYGGTAYGIEAAAQRYFNKAAKDLTLAEASLLAGLPQAPSRYSPFANPDAAKARQHEVLRRMVEDGYITQEVADQAFQAPLTYALPATDIKAPHFVFYIKSLIEDKYGVQAVERGGLRVTTTLDLELQEYAQASVSAEVDKIERYKVSNGAALITKPNTGEILAMVGSRNYFDTENDGQVNITQRLRQPGSSIKPLNYVTGLQLKNITPATMLLDIPTCFKVGSLAPYCPKNYDYSFHGPVQIRYALANSYNIPAVKVLALNSLESFIATASAMGISTLTDTSRYGLALTLGSGEVTMLDMATAFGTMANQGVKVPLQSILNITDYTGKVLESYDPQATQNDLSFYFDEAEANSNVIGESKGILTRVLNREPSYLISHILADNTARSAAFGSRSELVIPNEEVSVKTGTTNDLRDNWTIGYTPEFVVASWVGNNDNTPMNQAVVSGVTGAAPIWHDLMAEILKDRENLTQIKPIGVEGTNICRTSGAFPKDDQPCEVRFEYFWKANFPHEYNTNKKNIWVFKDSGQPAFMDKEPPKDFNTDNIELKEHLVISDPFTNDYCLDCSYGTDEQGKPKNPSFTVNMNTFRTQGL